MYEFINLLLLKITWTVSPEIISIGPLSIRWYGLFFATGFFIGFYIVKKMFQDEGAPLDWLDSGLIYIALGTIVGARLGHVFFYDWAYYSQNLLEIPMVWRGGLASHGAAIAIPIAVWLHSKYVTKKPMLWMGDKVAVTVALAGFFIRMGNLMNHEIVGKKTDVAWAFIFMEQDTIPRHPVQLYEALCYLLSFGILFYIYFYTNKKEKTGYIFGLFLILIFGFRILLEPFKESQGGLGDTLGLLSTGQWLSIPLVLIGLFLMFRPKK